MLWTNMEEDWTLFFTQQFSLPWDFRGKHIDFICFFQKLYWLDKFCVFWRPHVCYYVHLKFWASKIDTFDWVILLLQFKLSTCSHSIILFYKPNLRSITLDVQKPAELRVPDKILNMILITAKKHPGHIRRQKERLFKISNHPFCINGSNRVQTTKSEL